MQISNIRNYNLNNGVSFNAAVPSLERHLMPDTGKVSHKSAKLIKELNQCIEKQWADIKKGELISDSPSFCISDRHEFTRFEPVYSQRFPALKIDNEDGKFTHEILLDRNNPNNFRYEKTVKTDHGRATLKSYDSRISDDKEINTFVNNILENKLDRILMDKIWDRVLNRTKEDDILLFLNR